MLDVNSVKIGDLVIDINGYKWVVTGHFANNTCLELRGFDHHSKEAFLGPSDIVSHEPRPENVRWLFLARKEKAFAGMERYL